MNKSRLLTFLSLLTLVFAAGQTFAADAVMHEGPIPQANIPKYIVAATNAEGRSAEDRAMDASRKPEQTMAFFGIKPGMRVADLWAGGGYTTGLLARIVGSDGKVYSQNAPFPEKFKDREKAWKALPSEPGMSNVVEVTQPFDSRQLLPVKPDSLDAVLINLNYHDMIGRGYNRTNVNDQVFRALKPGGVYGIVDNSAKPGSGARDANTIHRIDENFVINEVKKAGFRLAATSDVLRNPNDDRTLPFWKMDHKQDRFILKFVKPASSS
jgi:predicted methyltransferase